MNKLKRVRGTVSLYICHTFPNVAHRSAKRDLLGPQSFPRGKVRTYERTLGFHSCAEHCQRSLFLPCPMQNTDVCCMTWGWRAAGRTAAKALKGHQRDVDPTNCLADSIRKHVCELLGDTLTVDLSTGP